ncbi:MAG: alpha-ketoglutarate-dependent dioxygenase AlkB [Acidimicrobiia bacterium]|nr:alpha-ketoglutarate-dependent dioxygenase AlkB [Acidimicrobiia bacterium]
MLTDAPPLDPRALTLQGSLFGAEQPTLHPAPGFERIDLDRECWIDVVVGWLRGGDELFARLAAAITWEAHDRPMYDRIVAVPRLTSWLSIGDTQAPSVLRRGAQQLAGRYDRCFDRFGCNLYRDGHDSVAWHGDRIGRTVERPVIAVLTLGGARPFLIRPAGGGPSVRFVPGSGDLIVMGGACQTRWHHAVPKVAAADPRISVTFRHEPDERGSAARPTAPSGWPPRALPARRS